MLFIAYKIFAGKSIIFFVYSLLENGCDVFTLPLRGQVTSFWAVKPRLKCRGAKIALGKSLADAIFT